MRVMPAHEYKGYTVVVNPAGSAAGKFRDAYSIHAGRPTGNPLGVSIVAQRSISIATEFDTVDEAHVRATELAHAWIDANP